MGTPTTDSAAAPQQPGAMPEVVPGTPVIAAVPEKKKMSIIEIIILVVVSLIAVTGISFAVYFYIQWDEAQSNVDGKIAEAEAIAREDQQRIAEANFAEREKEPNRRFTGPADYGSLSFMFPRTWSVYVARDASRGGDFEAFLNPGQVNEVGVNTINALRVSIINQPIEIVRMQYDSMVLSGQLTQSVFQNETITGDVFRGEFNPSISGIMVMFKVNDKTAILRTDAMIFEEDFNRVIRGITIN
jgi:hypothetical protein